MTSAAVSVVIACHTEDRFDQLLRAIRSAREQSPAPQQVIVAVDHNARLCGRLQRLGGVEIVDHQGVPGASGTRNAGAAHARMPLLVFLDDDVLARPGWLHDLLAPFADPHVIGTGGATVPAWPGDPPAWFPSEFGWVVGASHAGLPECPSPVRNVWSENMALRRDAFMAVGGFRVGFGKLGMTSRPEDTDLCIRVSASAPGARWIHVPTAVIEHTVPPHRTRFRFFVRRCYWEGAGKIELSAHLGADRDLGDERAYLTRTVPRALVRALAAGEVARGAAMAAGLLAAGLGGARSLERVMRQNLTKTLEG